MTQQVTTGQGTEVYFGFGYGYEQESYRLGEVNRLITGVRSLLITTQMATSVDLGEPYDTYPWERLQSDAIGEASNARIVRVSINSPFEVVLLINSFIGSGLLTAKGLLMLYSQFQEARTDTARHELERVAIGIIKDGLERIEVDDM